VHRRVGIVCRARAWSVDHTDRARRGDDRNVDPSAVTADGRCWGVRWRDALVTARVRSTTSRVSFASLGNRTGFRRLAAAPWLTDAPDPAYDPAGPGSMRKTLSPAAFVWTITTRSSHGGRQERDERKEVARVMVRRASRGNCSEGVSEVVRIERSYDRRAMDWLRRLFLALLRQDPPTASLISLLPDRVQPIFLEKARVTPVHLSRVPRLPSSQPLAPEAPRGTTRSPAELRSRRAPVVPGDPLRSRLLTMALAEEAGGPSPRRQALSQGDPEWKTLVDWVAPAHRPRRREA
jgi:hypothetical protein